MASLALEDRDEDTRTGQRNFFNTNPDGTLIGRAAFISQIARGSTVRNIREHDAAIRLFGDFAIIHARTTYQNSDGSEGGGRYTDEAAAGAQLTAPIARFARLRNGSPTVLLSDDWQAVRPTIRAIFKELKRWRFFGPRAAFSADPPAPTGTIAITRPQLCGGLR
jgi:Domain of unknown function (DUF4440)